MYFDQSQTLLPQQSLNISAKLIASINILQYSAEELEQSIASEIAENPALEVEEKKQCLRCGGPLQNGICSTCDNGRQTSMPSTPQTDWEDYTFENTLAHALNDEEDYDPISRVQSTASLAETLLLNMQAILPLKEFFIAEYLVGSLDGHGYLQTTVEEAAQVLRIPVEKVEYVLAILQSQEPLGVGARNVSECLLIQLRFLREHGNPRPLAEKLVANYLTKLGDRKFSDIAREMCVSSTQVREAWQFIKTNLNPYPAHAFDPSGGFSLGRNQETPVRPDVVIRRTAQGFEAEVIESRRFSFKVDPAYRQLFNRAPVKLVSESERQHIRQYTSRAQFFIDCIQQRWETLRKISRALVECQSEFLEKGVRHLKPLTRSDLAVMVGLHESTISRATANKYVLLPDGRTVPFDEFFDASLAAKDTLRELISMEDPAKPFSDEDLATLLAEKGLNVARRTVTKYRESMKILPSRLRN